MTAHCQLHGLIRHNEELNQVIMESLQQALLLLIEQKDYDDITITELCKKAGVSRMAFYHNFQTKDNLLEQVVLRLNQTLIAEIGSPFRHTTDLAWYQKLFRTVQSQEKALRVIFNAGFKYKYLSIINSLVLHDASLPSDKKYLRIMWTGGIMNTLIYWLDSGMQESVEEISAFCHDNLTADSAS